MEQFEVVLDEGPDAATLHLRGEIDLAASDATRERVEEALRSTVPQIVLDLSEATFLDSSGINAILGLYNGASSAGRSLVMRPGPEAVMKVLSLVGLDQVFDITE